MKKAIDLNRGSINQATVFVCLFLFGSLFYGCSKCGETTGDTENVSPLFIPVLFPYEEFKKIKFLKNKSDTVVFQNLGLQTKYNYSITEETECKPQKTPLEYKYMQFIDNVSNNNFVLSYYINYSFYHTFAISINDKTYTNGSILDIVKISELPQSTTILGKQYDTVTNIINVFNDSLTYKTDRYGLLKFTSNGNLFELIP